MTKSTFVRTAVIVIIAGAVILEICLRVFWGFGTMLLYDADPGYEYLARPNQDITRFGARVISNEYAMRSLPLNPGDSCIVLGFGDSVINGGVLTDQDSLATTIIEKSFQQEGEKGFRFLNISAGSWAPDNCAAYVRKHGSFNAKLMVLFVSSHDAHDNMTFEPIVGTHPSYPDKQYPLATIEVIDRYLWPRALGFFGSQPASSDTLMITKGGEEFNPGFAFFDKYSKQHSIPLVVCLHLEKAEVVAHKFNWQGDEIIKFCADKNIKLVSGLEVGEQPEDFRDDIHLNERGQRRWVNALTQLIRDNMKSCN